MVPRMRDISVTRFAFGDEQLFSIRDHVDSFPMRADDPRGCCELLRINVHRGKDLPARQVALLSQAGRLRLRALAKGFPNLGREQSRRRRRLYQPLVTTQLSVPQQECGRWLG